jgi:serine/threonine protein kinase
MRLNAFLADFGIGKFGLCAASVDAKTSQVTGSPCYMAPVSISCSNLSLILANQGKECFEGKASKKSDIFSLGCVMYEVCELKLAFTDVRRLKEPMMDYIYSTGIKEAVSSCLRLYSSERSSTAELKNRLERLLPEASFIFEHTRFLKM